MMPLSFKWTHPFLISWFALTWFSLPKEDYKHSSVHLTKFIFQRSRTLHVNSALSSQRWLMILICLQFLVAKVFSWLTISHGLWFKQPGTISTSSGDVTHAAGMSSAPPSRSSHQISTTTFCLNKTLLLQKKNKPRHWHRMPGEVLDTSSLEVG